MTPRVASIIRRLGLGLVVIVVLARCVPVLYWGDIHFEADQAVTGLMAKHVAEGRAFPVFQYAHSYVLTLEAWLGAPFVAIADGSVALVKAVPVLLNVATGVLLYLSLTSTTALGPFVALVVAAPIVLPGTVATRDLTDALGMNIEPLFFTLLLWLWRERPILLGGTIALAVKNREFALYAVAALMLVDLIRDRSAALWRGRLLALVAFALTWSTVGLLQQYSSPLGPDTSFAMLAGAGDNLSVAGNAVCVDPQLIPDDLWATATELLPIQFGVTMHRGSMARMYGARPLQAPWLWLPLAIVFAAGAYRGVLRAWRSGPSSMTWFGLYLVLVGMQAVLVYATTRCGHASTFTLRYLLLSLFIPVGALVLALEREPRGIVRALAIGVVSVWIGVCALGHLSLVGALRDAKPQGTYRQLATYLDERGVRFIVTDYWTGYHVAFLTGERIKALTNFERIRDYTLAVAANMDHAVEVRRRNEERCDGGVTVAGFYVCPSSESSHLP